MLVAFAIGTLAFWFDLPWLVWASAGLLVRRRSSSAACSSKLGYGVKRRRRYAAKAHCLACSPNSSPGRVADASARRAARSLAEVEAAALAAPPALDALAALAPADRVKIIAEVKRASPSRGALAEIRDPAAPRRLVRDRRGERDQRAHRGAPVRRLARRPRRRCAPPSRSRCCARTSSPTPYQVFEARAAGADLVLLIVAALEQTDAAPSCTSSSSQLGMTPLVETHSADEVERAARRRRRARRRQRPRPQHLRARPRPLRDARRPHPGRRHPRRRIGGASTPADVAHYRAAGADVVLVGEALVTGDDPVADASRASWSRVNDRGLMSLRDDPGPFFGEYGGRFMPESLIAALDELGGRLRRRPSSIPAFQAELAELHRSYTGRPVDHHRGAALRRARGRRAASS